MPGEIVLIVNGKPHTVQATADTPLLYVLRNELGLNGPQLVAAVANAIYDATGIRLRQIPFTHERVRAAVKSG